jgi:methionyl-tRNA formyltransferase
MNIKKVDEQISFEKNEIQVNNLVRGLNSWPGAYCIFRNKRLKVWESYRTSNSFVSKMNGEITAIYSDGFGVKVQNGEVVFTKVQPEGKNVMNAIDFVNGLNEDFVGRMLA